MDKDQKLTSNKKVLEKMEEDANAKFYDAEQDEEMTARCYQVEEELADALSTLVKKDEAFSSKAKRLALVEEELNSTLNELEDTRATHSDVQGQLERQLAVMCEQLDAANKKNDDDELGEMTTRCHNVEEQLCDALTELAALKKNDKARRASLLENQLNETLNELEDTYESHRCELDRVIATSTKTLAVATLETEAANKEAVSLKSQLDSVIASSSMSLAVASNEKDLAISITECYKEKVASLEEQVSQK